MSQLLSSPTGKPRKDGMEFSPYRPSPSIYIVSTWEFDGSGRQLINYVRKNDLVEISDATARRDPSLFEPLNISSLKTMVQPQRSGSPDADSEIISPSIAFHVGQAGRLPVGMWHPGSDLAAFYELLAVRLSGVGPIVLVDVGRSVVRVDDNVVIQPIAVHVLRRC